MKGPYGNFKNEKQDVKKISIKFVTCACTVKTIDNRTK